MALNLGQFVKTVESYIGSPSGQGPSATGPKFDCSGLVYRALVDLGYPDPPRDTASQWALVNKINKKQLTPGDLVFSNWPGDTENPGHVQVYIGNGQVVQSPGTTSGSVDQIALTSDIGHIVGYGRLPMATTTGPQGPANNPTGPAGPTSGPSGSAAPVTNDPTLSAALQKNFTPTEGWYVAGACLVGVLFANTRAGPIIIGILAIALIFQTSLLLQGK